MKDATSQYPLHELIAARWSPRAFSDRSVPPEALGSLFEAARWAPSCFNEQPWSFVVASKDETESFERLASCLMEGNSWAAKAPVLILSVAKLAFSRNGNSNRHALHDVGLAVENLVLQAESMGLSTHQMAGFHVERAREALAIPEGHDPVAMIAVGYRDAPETLSEELERRETATRERRPLAELVHSGVWGEPRY